MFFFFRQLHDTREDLEVRELKYIKYINRNLFIYLDRYKTIPIAHFCWIVF